MGGGRGDFRWLYSRLVESLWKEDKRIRVSWCAVAGRSILVPTTLLPTSHRNILALPHSSRPVLHSSLHRLIFVPILSTYTVIISHLGVLLLSYDNTHRLFPRFPSPILSPLSKKPPSSRALRAAWLICLNRSGPRCMPPKYRVTTTSTLFTS